jgi:tetratricopeptide (TPR) repeat protein
MPFIRRFGIALWLLLPALPVAAGDEPAATADKPAPAAAPETADAPGQEALNEAIDAKLAVDELDDYARVLDLCRKAVDQGLDEESRKFAEDLYTGTLIDRAGMLTEAIFRPGRPDPQWQRIRAFAMRDLEEVVGRDPKLGGAHLMIARLQALPGGDKEKAAQAAAKALGLLGDDRLQRAQATLVLADLTEDAREKAAFYDAAVELSPRDAEVRRARGLFRLTADEYDAAREDLMVAAEEDPQDAAVQEALGLACLMAEKFDDAKAAFGRAIELAPDAIGPLLQRARIWAIEKDRDQALEDIDRAIDIDPENPAALLLRARINQQAGDTEAALADIQTILDDKPDTPAALELRGLIAAEQEDYAAAIRDFRKLAARDPDDAAVVGQLAMLYLAAKQPREAIRRFTRALEIDTDNFPCRRGRSDAAISIGDHPAALADLQKAHELEPDDSGVLNNLAWLLATSPDADLRDGKRAIELATKACEETKWEEAHIISTLAAAYAEAGDFDSARKYSKQAVEKGAENDEVKEQLEAELASYEAAKPWRERQTQDEAGAEAAEGNPAADEPAQDKPEPGDMKREQGKPDPDRPARRPFDDA